MQRRIITFALIMAATLPIGSSSALAQYRLINLSSNQVGKAHNDDPLLVNAWGLVHGPGTPWWISDNNSGWSTLYDQTGKAQGLRVLIPTTGNGPGSPTGLNGPGSPTGVVHNITSAKGGTQEFKVDGWASIFIFATLDGTISGWTPLANANQAVIAVDNGSNGSVYTGLAITNRVSGNLLYAANMAKNLVEIYNNQFQMIGTLTDPSIPAGFAPFGVQDIDGKVFVTYASSSGGKGGFVDLSKEDGTLVQTLIHGEPLNQPWGVAAAPRDFGPLSNTLLISNNTNDGTINGFDALTGTFVGALRGLDGKAIQIDQLWAIGFGDGLGSNGGLNQLFFTAGPANNVAGTFGLIAFKY